jgi:hypothetical protein
MFGHMLDAALALGVLINLVKAGDLVLRPNQQARVQAWIEDLTLRVEEIRPIGWLERLTRPHAHVVLVLVGVFEFVLVLLLVTLVPAGKTAALGPVGSNVFVMQLVAIVCSVPALVLTAKRYGPPFVAWLLGPAPVRGVTRRFLKTLVLGFLVLGLYEVILFGLVFFLWGDVPFDAMELPIGEGGPGIWVLGGGLLVVWPAFTWFWVITQVAGLILWAIVGVRFFEMLLKWIRALCWRVVEYNKGAWAAVVLIITIMLGVAKLLSDVA